MKKLVMSILNLSILSTVLILSGCTAMIAGAVISTFPTYQEFASEIPEIPKDAGRVFIYFPNKGGAVMSGFATVAITIDDKMETSIGDGTFVVADLVEGKHNFSIKKPGPYNKSEIIEIDIVREKAAYLKVLHGAFTMEPPVIVGEKEAMRELALLHHNYKLSLPFHNQSKNATRAF